MLDEIKLIKMLAQETRQEKNILKAKDNPELFKRSKDNGVCV